MEGLQPSKPPTCVTLRKVSHSYGRSDRSRAHITRLRVKHYRSLADIDIGDLNVFVGKHGSGKSTVIDVLLTR